MTSAQVRLAALILTGGSLASGGWEFVCPGAGNAVIAAEAAASPTTVPSAATTRPATIRQKFVPGKDDRGTSFTALTPFDKDGISRLFADVTLAGTFPVERDGKTIFNVTMLEGDDDHLILEVREKESKRKLELQKDKSVTLTAAGQEYHILYPSVTVNAGSAPTTSAAFIVMTQKKK